MNILARAITLPPVAAFDYGGIAPASVLILQNSVATIRAKISKTTQDIIDTGKELAAAKDHFDHGQFTAWVESEIGIAARTAAAYMSAARLGISKGATVALLPPATVYRLAARSAPVAVVDEVMARAKSGDMVSDKAVQAMLADARHQQRQTEAAEQKNSRQRKVGKRKSEQREAERQRIQEQQQRDRQAVADAAAAIRERFSADDVAFIVEQFSAGYSAHDVLRALSDGGAA